MNAPPEARGHSWPEPPPATPCTAPDHATVGVGIVGAGIHGAALARELTLRGVSCALIDVSGIGSGTSQWSTQLLHGGIRYLRTGDFRQIREGLAERATWMQIAPRLCRWNAFWMPHRSWWEGATHRVGISFYDRIWGRNRPGWPSDLKLGKVPRAAFRADPRSSGGPFVGAVAYADLMTDDRALVRDLAASSDALRYDFHEVTGWDRTADALSRVQLRDRRDGHAARTVAASNWVAALGPWNDRTLAEWFGAELPESPRLRLSSGIHLWLDPVPGCDRPWAIMRPGNRIVFVIPRDGLLQVGTTEREVHDGFVPVVDEERDYLYGALEAEMPAVAWRSLAVRAEESGVRPLVLEPGQTSQLSREARLDVHARYSNLRLVLGGKLTTARLLMDQLATQITGQKCPASRSTPLVNADT